MPTLNARSNKASWTDFVQFLDDETNEKRDISHATEITVRVAEKDCDRVLMEASLSDGTVTIDDEEIGLIWFSFSASQMQRLCSQTYDVGVLVTFEDDPHDDVEQAILGRLPVLKGL